MAKLGYQDCNFVTVYPRRTVLKLFITGLRIKSKQLFSGGSVLLHGQVFESQWPYPRAQARQTADYITDFSSVLRDFSVYSRRRSLQTCSSDPQEYFP